MTREVTEDSTGVSRERLNGLRGDTPVGVLKFRHAVALLVTVILSCLAGGVLVWGAAARYDWQVALILVALMVVAIGTLDERVGLALYAVSFLTIADEALRLKVGPLWIPAPALIAGLLGMGELIRRMSGAAKAHASVPAVGLLILLAGLIGSGVSAVRVEAYVAELAKWIANMFVLVTLLLVLRRVRWVHALVDGLTAVIAVLALYGLRDVFAEVSYSLDIFAGIASRNAAAMFIAALLPIAYARLLGSAGAERLARLSVVTVLVVALVFTYSRGGWIAAASGLVVVAGRRVRPYALMVLAGALLVATVPLEIRDRFLSIFVVADAGTGSRFGSSTIVRELLLLTGISMLRDHWLLGVGLGNFVANYHRYAVPGSTPHALQPHNFYVLLWAEAGIVSIVGFLWLFGSRVWRMWVAQRYAGKEAGALRGFVGCFVALAVDGCFSNDINNILIWTLLGAGSALAYGVRGGEQECG